MLKAVKEMRFLSWRVMQKGRGQRGLVLCGKRVKDITFVRIRRADPGFANGRGEKKANQLFSCILLQLSQAKTMEGKASIGNDAQVASG